MPAINASEATLLSLLTQLTNPSGLNHGQVVVANAGTEQVLGGDTPLVVGVTVKALESNSGKVYVGVTGVDNSNGYELSPGEQQFIPIDNLQTIFLDVDNDGEGVSFMGN